MSTTPEPHRQMGYGLRPLELRDVPQVAEIEKEAFPTLWPPTPFRREINNRMARYLVAWESSENADAARVPLPAPTPSRGWRWPLLGRLRSGGDGRIAAPEPAPEYLVGFEGIWFMTDEAHVTAVGVRASHRSRGIGELLIIGAIELALRHGSRVATLEARVSNHVAQSLYRKYGFQDMGIRKGYYVDNNEDALIMTTYELHTPEYHRLFQGLVRAHEERRGQAPRVLGQ